MNVIILLILTVVVPCYIMLKFTQSRRFLFFFVITRTRERSIDHIGPKRAGRKEDKGGGAAGPWGKGGGGGATYNYKHMYVRMHVYIMMYARPLKSGSACGSIQ